MKPGTLIRVYRWDEFHMNCTYLGPSELRPYLWKLLSSSGKIEHVDMNNHLVNSYEILWSPQ